MSRYTDFSKQVLACLERSASLSPSDIEPDTDAGVAKLVESVVNLKLALDNLDESDINWDHFKASCSQAQVPYHALAIGWARTIHDRLVRAAYGFPKANRLPTTLSDYPQRVAANPVAVAEASQTIPPLDVATFRALLDDERVRAEGMEPAPSQKADDGEYVFLSDLQPPRIDKKRQRRRYIEEHSHEIRSRVPLTAAGTPHLKRLEVHLGDWVRHWAKLAPKANAAKFTLIKQDNLFDEFVEGATKRYEEMFGKNS